MLLLLTSCKPLSFANKLVLTTKLFKIERVSAHVYAAIAQTTAVVSGNSEFALEH